MGFDRKALTDAVAEHGRVVRVVIAAVRGSSPREVGAAMLVWADGQSGTIGGGVLEYQVVDAARKLQAASHLETHALGPDLGQCCGGAVTLLSESFDAARLAELPGDVIARPTGANTGPSLRVKRILALARNQGQSPASQLVDGWMIEPVHTPDIALWIWGAGHVGRALVDVLSPLPDLAITWIDTSPDRFPRDVPAHVTTVPAHAPALMVRHAPKNAHHLVLTYSHEQDLALCNALLAHGFSFAGLIGSATKWARFRSRLAGMGYRPDQIAQITCPIGDPSLGKHPQMIAVGVAAALLQRAHSQQIKTEDKRA